MSAAGQGAAAPIVVDRPLPRSPEKTTREVRFFSVTSKRYDTDPGTWPADWGVIRVPPILIVFPSRTGLRRRQTGCSSIAAHVLHGEPVDPFRLNSRSASSQVPLKVSRFCREMRPNHSQSSTQCNVMTGTFPRLFALLFLDQLQDRPVLDWYRT